MVLTVVNCTETFNASLTDREVNQSPASVAGLYDRMVFSSVSTKMLEAYQRRHATALSFVELGREAENAMTSAPAVKLDIATSEATREPIFDTQDISHGQATLAIIQAVAERLKEHLACIFDNTRSPDVIYLGGAHRPLA